MQDEITYEIMDLPPRETQPCFLVELTVCDFKKKKKCCKKYKKKKRCGNCPRA